MRCSGKKCLLLAAMAWFAVLVVDVADAAEDSASWQDLPTRTWIGPEFSTNRLQDWRLSDRRLEWIPPQHNVPLRAVFLLIRQLSDSVGAGQTSIYCGETPGKGDMFNADAIAGFIVDVGTGKVKYRGAAMISGRLGRGAGIICGKAQQVQLHIIDLEKPLPAAEQKIVNLLEQIYRLELLAALIAVDSYRLTLRVHNPTDGKNRG